MTSPSPGTAHITGVGSCTITASQAGDGSYNPAANVPQGFTINKANQTITFAALATKTFGDPDFAVSATASSGLAVSLTASGNCTVTSSSPGTAHISGAGSCTITASQAGDANYNPATSVPQGFIINKANQTIAFGALANKTFGDPDFAVSATASSGLAVSLTASGNCTVTSSSPGTAHITGAGSFTITASQAGDGNYNSATNVSQSLAVARGTPTISWTPTVQMLYGTSLSSTQLSATVAFNGNALSGTFSYSPDAGTVLPVGNNQVLSTTFTPSDTTNLNSATANRTINVLIDNRSLSVDGTSGYLEAPNSTSLNITGSAITLEAWVKMPTTNTGNYQSILDKAPWSNTEGGYDLCITDQGKARIDVYYGAYYVGLIGNTVLSANAWHHVAGVYNGSQLQIYVDGNLDGSYNTSVSITPTSYSLMIGRVHNLYNQQLFHGLIDEIRVSNAVLYTGSFTPLANLRAASSTVALWKFNGQTANDSSGNGNSGTLSGGAGYSTDVPP